MRDELKKASETSLLLASSSVCLCALDKSVCSRPSQEGSAQRRTWDSRPAGCSQSSWVSRGQNDRGDTEHLPEKLHVLNNRAHISSKVTRAVTS